MTKFNKPVNVVDKINNHPEATTNHAGGLHFNTDAEMDLYLKATVGFLDDKYYQNSEEVLKELRAAISKVSRSFVLKLANYARNKMYLRSIPMVLLAEAAHTVFPGENPNADKGIVREYTPKIIMRADEINEVLAYSVNVIGKGHKKNLANSLKKGIADSFMKFDEYQFAKYNRKGAFTFRDTMRVVRPKTNDPERNALLGRIIKDELATPETWEVVISGKGSTAENWNAVAPKMGIMALLRNLRNMEDKGAKEGLKIAYAALRNPEKVLNSKLLPFRFFAAMQEVGLNATRDALHDAMDIAVGNLPKIKGNLAVFSDTSGSMSSVISAKSKVTCLDIATLFGAMTTNMVDTGYDYQACSFAENVVNVGVSKRDSVFTNMDKLKKADKGNHSTNAYKIFPYLRSKSMKPDVVVIFSDMQCYNSSNYSFHGRQNREDNLAVQWEKYKREVNPNAVLVSVHLNGYGGSQFPPNTKDVVLLSGWSENVLSFIAAYQERLNVLDEIKNNY